MKIGAYQFAITNDIEKNFTTVKKAVQQAVTAGVELLVFPECALTGYPPHDMETSADVDFERLEQIYKELQDMVNQSKFHMIVGTIVRKGTQYYNTALLLSPGQEVRCYHKRALWGWDKDNFTEGSDIGVFTLQGMRIGIRICYEVRFPEFFRELYEAGTDLNIILFYDVQAEENLGRFELIKSYVRVRADENVCNTLAVNTARSFQTCPTILYDGSGKELAGLPRHTEGLLVHNLEKKELSFGECGKKKISDRLLKVKQKR